jgi:hypothetical protein
MIGWIKLHRKITDHWLWLKPEYFQWWIDILIQANFEDKKVLIKNQVIECKRGDVLYSLDTWAKRWKTNKSKVKRFLEMLEKDNMICIKSETVSTRITICNYDSYQDIRNEDETQVKRNRNASETQVKPTKERKEIQEKKEDDILPENFDFETENRIQKATKLISDFFSISEINQAKHFMSSGNFVRYHALKGKLDYVASQFTAYRIVKEKDTKFIHTWNKYIGSPEKSYEDGQWNIKDWSKEISKHDYVKSDNQTKKSYQRTLELLNEAKNEK